MSGTLTSQALDRANYDAKKFPYCFPWNGVRGAQWSLIFKPEFEDSCRGKTDNFSSQFELLVTQTDYGGANGPAHPGGPGTQFHVTSQAARRTQIESCYSAILKHACQLQGHKERVKAHVANVLTGAPSIADFNLVIANTAAIAAAPMLRTLLSRQPTSSL